MRQSKDVVGNGRNGMHKGESNNGSDLALQFARLGLKSWIVGSLNGSCNDAVKSRLTHLFQQHRYVDAMAVRNDVKRGHATADSSCRRIVCAGAGVE
jgi:hypothetical protein